MIPKGVLELDEIRVMQEKIGDKPEPDCPWGKAVDAHWRRTKQRRAKARKARRTTEGSG